MEDFLGFVLLVVSTIVIIDFGRAGFLLRSYIYRDEVRKHGQPLIDFLRGLSYLLFTVPAFVLFWLIVVILGELVEGVVLSFVIGFYSCLCIVAVVGRVRWWNKIVNPIIKRGPEANDRPPGGAV